MGWPGDCNTASEGYTEENPGFKLYALNERGKKNRELFLSAEGI